MNKNFYIIPGWEDTPNLDQYQKLQKIAENKGYKVSPITVDWKKPLSEQVFTVPDNSVIFGFSLGAILAWLIAQENSCEHIILASMTPNYSFKESEIISALIELTGKEFTEDIIKNLKEKHLAKKQTIIYGDQEGEPADILVPNTDHEISDEYLIAIKGIL